MVTTSDGGLVNSMTRAHIMFKLSSRRIGFHGLRELHNTSDVVMFFLYNVAHAAKPMSPKIAFFFLPLEEDKWNYVQPTKDVLIRTRAARLEREFFQLRRNRGNECMP